MLKSLLLRALSPVTLILTLTQNVLAQPLPADTLEQLGEDAWACMRV
jgi:hypothetical protein